MTNERDRTPMRTMVGGTSVALAGLVLILHACSDEPTASERVAQPTASFGAIAAPVAGSTAESDGGASISGALAGKLPSTDTVTSTGTAFEIKQKGSGIAGRFEITSTTSSSIALDGVTSGNGHALLAWNLGLGRGAMILTSNTNNTLPTLDVSAQSSGTAVDIKANNPTGANPAVKGTTYGLGRAADFLVNNVNNASSAVEALTVGRGMGGAFRITNTANTSVGLLATTTGSGAAVMGSTSGTGSAGRFEITNAASSSHTLTASQAGTGVAFFANHTGPSPGNIAIFQSDGANKIRFSKAGKGFFNNGTQTGGADVAEALEVEGHSSEYEPGDVMVISTRSDQRVEKSSASYSTLVIGVYATKPGVLLTEREIDDDLAGTVPVGVVGVIPTKVSTENGAIRRGDLLVTASTRGHAMRGTRRDRMLGAVIGKAMEGFAGPGTGKIKVLVNVK